VIEIFDRIVAFVDFADYQTTIKSSKRRLEVLERELAEEEATNFHTAIFKNSKIVSIMRYGAAGPGPRGSVMSTTFQGPWLGISSGRRHMTVLEFRHSGWDESSEYFGFCNFAWGETLLMLKQ
jgi:hypothetical protein